MQVTFKTYEQLKLNGFKPDSPYWYKGDKKNYDERLKQSMVDYCQGKKVTFVDAEVEENEITIERLGRVFTVSPVVLLEKLNWDDAPTAKRYDIGRGDFVTYRAGEFDFPCDTKELTTRELRGLAKWMLKVSEP